MSRKFVIELDDSTYEDLLNTYKELEKITSSEINFEKFVSDILSQYVVVKNKAQDLYGNISKEVLENFNLDKLDDVMSSIKNFNNSFGETTSKTKAAETKDEEKSSSNDEPPVRKKS